MSSRFTDSATCRCTNCGMEYEVPADPDNSDIDIETAAEHGADHHQDERWNYEIIERPSIGQ